MLVSLEWLKDYTDINVSTTEFCDGMIMSGSNLETCEELGKNILKVVVGRIEKIEQHPDADKLVVCQINIGEKELVQIVTGAPNVFEGAVVPVACNGSKIPGAIHGKPQEEGGTTITGGELRGVFSNGMLCSFSELGYDDKVIPTNMKDGIWIIEGAEDKIGQPIETAMELYDQIIDFEITPNRPDCLSMIGMAREAAVTFGTELKYPETKIQGCSENASDYIQVEIKSDLCKRYTARIIKDVKIGPSPWWLQKRLMHAGMRPINNMVDITNYVMLEYGQPLHAFDIEGVAGRKIIIDVAKSNEKFTTLDEKERVMTNDMLMINDGEKAIAIAGVMGGMNSEIEQTTKVVVLESANFNNDSVRSTSKKLGLRTEASARYSKGIDSNLCEIDADRVCYLVQKLNIGTVVNGSVDVYKKPEISVPVNVRVSRVNAILGINETREYMTNIFEKLEMKVEGSGDNMIVTPPTIRQDLLEEVDFIEEIARMYGYDKMPSTLPKGNSEAKQSKEKNLVDIAKNTLVAQGVSEIQTYSFVSPRSVDLVGIDEDSWERDFVRLLNPLGEENSVMRTILTPNMLEVLGRNFSRNISNVRGFEIGNTFLNNHMGDNELPFEQYALSLGIYGKDEDFYTLKGIVEETLNNLGIKELIFVAESQYGIYHPGRCARVTTIINGDEIELGIMGEVHPDVTERYAIGTKCYCAEIMFDKITEISNKEILYKQLPKYPGSLRDIALIVDEDLEIGKMMDVIKGAATEILKDVALFDIYRGKQVEEGKKSVAFTLTYRHDDRTLTDEDIIPVHNNILEELKNKLNATLREV